MAVMDSALKVGQQLAESQSAVVAENWRLLHYVNIFRVLAATLAVTVAFIPMEVGLFGSASPNAFLALSLLFLGTSIGAFELSRGRKGRFETIATALPFLDVVFITLLAHASGGLGSGLELLLVVAVAAASLMVSKRMMVFYASLATVAILLEHSWGFFVNQPVPLDRYPQVGLLGVGMFATAMLGFVLAQRLRATEALAQRRGLDLANLAQINEQIIRRMQSGVLVCDLNGRVLTANASARKFFGLGGQEGAGRTPLPDFAPDLTAQLAQWLQNPDNPVRRLVRTRAGYTLLPRFMKIGERREDTGLLIFLEDAGVVRQQAQQLKMAALARLTASIAHEIRNPLGAITNAAQLLQESAGQEPEEQRLVKIIEDQSRRMNVIIENVMQLSRRDQANPRLTDLKRWLEEFLRNFCETYSVPVGALQTVGERGVQVYVDADQLFQVVANLCQNALRHSPAFAGDPLVKIQLGLDAEGRPFLDIVDWGSGIPPEVVDNIFDPFFTTTPRGTGLGLYIARELCEGNGGRLDYFPGDTKGSRFRVTLPRPQDSTEFAVG